MLIFHSVQPCGPSWSWLQLPRFRGQVCVILSCNICKSSPGLLQFTLDGSVSAEPLPQLSIPGTHCFSARAPARPGNQIGKTEQELDMLVQHQRRTVPHQNNSQMAISSCFLDPLSRSVKEKAKESYKQIALGTEQMRNIYCSTMSNSQSATNQEQCIKIQRFPRFLNDMCIPLLVDMGESRGFLP